MPLSNSNPVAQNVQTTYSVANVGLTAWGAYDLAGLAVNGGEALASGFSAADAGVGAVETGSAVADLSAENAGGWAAGGLESPTFTAAQAGGETYVVSGSGDVFANTGELTGTPIAAPADIASAAPVEGLSAAQSSSQIDPAITAELEQANTVGAAPSESAPGSTPAP